MIAFAEPPDGEPPPVVGFIPVRCPECRTRDVRSYGASLSRVVRYLECRRCKVVGRDGRLRPKRFKAVDVGQR